MDLEELEKISDSELQDELRLTNQRLEESTAKLERFDEVLRRIQEISDYQKIMLERMYLLRREAVRRGHGEWVIIPVTPRFERLSRIYDRVTDIEAVKSRYKSFK